MINENTTIVKPQNHNNIQVSHIDNESVANGHPGVTTVTQPALISDDGCFADDLDEAAYSDFIGMATPADDDDSRLRAELDNVFSDARKHSDLVKVNRRGENSKRRAKKVREFNGAAALRYCDAGHANAFYQLRGERYAYTNAVGWRMWTGSHWATEKAESALWADIRSLLIATVNERMSVYDTENAKKSMPTVGLISGVMNHLHHDCMSLEDEFQPVAHLLNCKNGVVDLRTGELLPHDPEHGFTYCLDTDYIPGAKSALWEKQLTSMFPSSTGEFSQNGINADSNPVIDYLQKCLGYSITGETKEEICFYMYGPSRCGKGTILNTVAAIMGKWVSKAVSFDTFENTKSDPQNFRLAGLANARYVVASESDQSNRLNEALIKQLTGRDDIQAAFKGRDSFNFTPTFKLWLMSNFNINGRFDDAAFWGRWRLFTVTGESHLENPDTNLKDLLLQQENREGILSWLVDGAIAYYIDGLRDTPDVMRYDLKKQRDVKDVIGAWLGECVTQSDTAEATTDSIYESYIAWCDDMGIKDDYKKSKVAVTRTLSDRGFVQAEGQVTVNGKRTRQWYVRIV